MARFNWRDPLGWAAKAVEAAEARKDELKLEMRADVLNWIQDNPTEWVDHVSESLHTAEMNWRNKQNFYALTGKDAPGRVDDEARRKNVWRSRNHYLNNPLYVRAINLSADFIYGKGVSDPRLVKNPPEGMPADSVFKVVDSLWHDPMNLRVLSSTRAQQDRCRQLLIDGEVPWLLFPPKSNGAGYQWWPSDTVEWTVCIEHPDMPSVPLLHLWQSGSRKKWYWSADAPVMFEGGIDDKVKAQLLKDSGGQLTVAKWDEDELDERLNTGPYVYMWAWTNNPMGVRGHPPFYAALDWGEVNVGLAGNLQTYIKSITAITYKIRGPLTANDISTLRTNLASKLSLTKPPPGTATWRAEGLGQEMTPMDVPTGGATLFQTGFEVSRLMISAATGIPVHWLGDPSTGNLATATAMELPQLKIFEGWQRWFLGQYDEMFRIVTRFETGSNVDTARLLEIDFPELVSRNVSEVLQALAIAKQNSLISDEDAARQAGRQLGEDDIESYVDRVMAEPEEMVDTMTNMFEEQPRQAMAVFRKAAARLKERNDANDRGTAGPA